jgi:hypothetical protein
MLAKMIDKIGRYRDLEILSFYLDAGRKFHSSVCPRYRRNCSIQDKNLLNEMTVKVKEGKVM